LQRLTIADPRRPFGAFLEQFCGPGAARHAEAPGPNPLAWPCCLVFTVITHHNHSAHNPA